MTNNYFQFKQFTIIQERSAFKVGTDGVILGAYADLAGAKRILDIGTGTGLIAIMMAQRSQADIIAIEPHVESFLEACDNVGNCKWQGRIEVMNVGLQQFIRGNTGNFDLLISNPPYFRDSLRNPDASKSFTRHSDNLSSSEILEGAERLLTPDGNLQLILPYAEGTLFIAEATGYGFFCTRLIKIKPVPAGEIKRLILKFERTRKPISERFLTIESGKRHRYTDEYRDITKDFYLEF